MGKGQSKQGECYLVNAHFNPLCQLEESNSLQSIETPLTSQDSGLQLTPEISFTLSEENRSHSEKNITAKCDLEVFLPQESVSAALRESIIDLKGDNSGVSSINDFQQDVDKSVQSGNPSDQEFSFVLKNNNEKTEKEDVGEVMLRSICDALKTSLKLPPSGTHTIKVHLTVSPDKNDSSAHDRVEKSMPNIEELNLLEDNLFLDSSVTLTPTKNAFYETKTSTPPPQETPISVNYANVFAKCCQQDNISMKLPHSPARNLKPSSSPSLQAKNKILAHRKEARKWLHASEMGRHENTLLNMKNSPRHSTTREKRYHHCNVQRPNTEECSHYLDLADLKSSIVKETTEWSNNCDQRYINPAYCSPRHVEKAHFYCRTPKQTLVEKSTPKSSCKIKQALQNPDMHSGLLKYKLLNKAKDNLLDLSFDLCDLEDKQSSAREIDQNRHKRSQSQDNNEYMYTNSPKPRHRTCNCTKCGTAQSQNYGIPMSPSRHHRHRHKEREKDKIRAMQQVVNWLEREDLSHVKHDSKKDCHQSDTCSQSDDTVIERHEYHHIHEHHHYYHYVNS